MIDNKNKTCYNIIIIGCGPAGMTAALYAARANKSVLILDKEDVGGMIVNSPKIDNYPGCISIPGSDLASQMFKQMEGLDICFKNFTEATAVYCGKDEKIYVKTSDDDTFIGDAVIIATGTSPKKLPPFPSNPHDDNIHYCVMCDGFFYKDKKVAVVGAGNTGAQYALELAQYCDKVTVVEKSMNPLCEKTMLDKLMQKENIDLKIGYTVRDFNPEEGKLHISSKNDDLDVECSGIFVSMGMEPNLNNFGNVIVVDGRGFASVGCDQSSEHFNSPGIFLAGDCVSKSVRQITTAVSDGTIAAVSAIKYIDSKEKNNGK